MKYFTKDHEWVELNGSVATIGISVHAAAELGDITFVEIPAAGKVVAKSGVVSVVESVKAASDIYCPVAGTVSEGNAELDTKPELINEDAEGAGWICKLSGVNAADLTGLMDEAAYKTFLG